MTRISRSTVGGLFHPDCSVPFVPDGRDIIKHSRFRNEWFRSSGIAYHLLFIQYNGKNMDNKLLLPQQGIFATENWCI